MSTSQRLDIFPGPKPMTEPWPKGIRCACLLTFDFDADVVWAYQGIKDPVSVSMGKFGPKVGIPSLLNLLDMFDIKTTFFVPAWVIENYPAAVEQVVERGHEIGHHGYVHEPRSSFTSFDEEEEKIVRAMEVVTRFCGRRPIGYRAPYFDLSLNTLAILEKHDFQYTSELMDTLVPEYHLINGRKSGMLNLPIHWVLDDLAHIYYHITARKSILTCRQVLEHYTEQFEAIYAYRGLFTLVMHPEESGRPSRVLMLKTLIERLKSQSDVWLTSPAEVVKYWQSAYPLNFADKVRE